MRVGIPRTIGPRVLCLAHPRQPDFNLLGITPRVTVETPEGTWNLFGGHRLWSSPEAMPRSYSADNEPVKIEVSGETVTIEGNPEQANGIRKRIRLEPASESSVRVTHTIENISRWPVRFACWALSVMRQNGFAIVPIEPVAGDAFLPDRRLSLWQYTDLADPRIKFLPQYLVLKQDPDRASPVKLGILSGRAWCAYSAGTLTFIKRFTLRNAEYPDFGCAVEVYTNREFLELETVGQLETVDPGAVAVHEETWSVLETGPMSPDQDRIRDRIGCVVETLAG